MPKIQDTFDRLKGRLNDMAEEQVKERLVDMADYTTRISPVDTGAYVTSFSITTGAGRPRGKSSENRPKNQNPQVKQGEGFNLLMGDIAKLNIADRLASGNMRVTLRNNSPHARDVEDGANWRSSGYHVFARIRRKFG